MKEFKSKINNVGEYGFHLRSFGIPSVQFKKDNDKIISTYVHI